MSQKSIGLTRTPQLEAWDDAKELVRDDFGDHLTDGDVVRVVCEAYAGQLEEIPNG